MSPLARRGLTVLGLAVTVVFAWLAVRGTHPREVWAALRESRVEWILASLVVAMASIAVRAVRWRALFLPETRPPVRAVAAATLVGYFFNNVLPLRAGEAARVVDLSRRARVAKAEALATVGVERAYDLAVTLLLLFAVLPWLPEVTWLRAAGALAAALAVALVAAAVVLAVYGERPLQALVRPMRLLRFDANRVAGMSSSLHRGLAGLRRPAVALVSLAWTLAAWGLTIVSAWLLFFAFDLDLSFVAATLVVVAIGLAMVLPSSPGALGVFEAAGVLALDAYGVDRAEALSYAIVWHALNVLPLLAVGWIPLRVHARR